MGLFNKKKIKQEEKTNEFSFRKEENQQINFTRRDFSRPNQIDWTNSVVANEPLLRGFYANTYPGLKLAGVFAKKPIDIPIGMMGVPIPKLEGNVRIQKKITKWVEENIDIFKTIHFESHLIGTCWVWPNYSTKTNKIQIEFIPDSSVLPPIKDIETGEITQIITDEEFNVIYAEDKTTLCRRKRIFTKDYIKIVWENKGMLSGILKDETYRNPIGIVPINFTNKKSINETRGHSDYESFLSDIKDYHDTSLSWISGLVKFKPKQVHTLAPGMTPEDWELNNGIKIDTVDIYNRDFYVNRDGEKDEFIAPNGAFSAFKEKLEVNYWKIVQGSDIPELYWGLNAVGNHATEENSRNQIISYTLTKQNQHTKNYKILFGALAKLFSIIEIDNREYIVNVEWNKLNAVDQKTQVQILGNFVTAVSGIINGASGTLGQIYALWNEMYPGITEDDYDEWREKLSLTAKHKAFASADYEMIADMEGNETDKIKIDESKPQIIPGKKIEEKEKSIDLEMKKTVLKNDTR